MTEQSKALLEVNKKGYRIDEEGLIINPNGDVLKGVVVNKKYPYKAISTKLNGKKVFVKVHRLQAFQKYGNKIFEKGIHVRHKNGISLDNSKKNILIGTQSQNMMDRPKEERVKNASNPKHDHEAIKTDYDLGMTYNELMTKYDISSKGTISFIVNKSLVSSTG